MDSLPLGVCRRPNNLSEEEWRNFCHASQEHGYLDRVTANIYRFRHFRDPTFHYGTLEELLPIMQRLAVPADYKWNEQVVQTLPPKRQTGAAPSQATIDDFLGGL